MVHQYCGDAPNAPAGLTEDPVGKKEGVAEAKLWQLEGELNL